MTSRRLVLGLETGGEHLSAALLEAGSDDAAPAAPAASATTACTLLGETRVRRGDVRADLALTMVSQLLERAGVAVADLALIAVARGPGGFTGIRVALSLAQGLSLASGVPVWPVSSLAALALNAVVPGTHVLALLDAKKGEVYAAAYRLETAAPPRTLLAPRVGTCESALAAAREAVPTVSQGERMVVLGSGALAYGVASPLPAVAHIGAASAVAELALREWAAAGFDAGASPAVDAAYLRKSEAEIAADIRDAAAAAAAKGAPTASLAATRDSKGVT